MTQPDLSTAMLLEALAQRTDPLTRFIDSLPDNDGLSLRKYAQETVRLHADFIANTQRLLTATNVREVAGYAAWLAKNAHEVGYRWASLRDAAVKWSMLDTAALCFQVRAPGEESSR